MFIYRKSVSSHEAADGLIKIVNPDPKNPGYFFIQIAINPATQPNLSAPRIPQQDFIFIQSYLKNSTGNPFVIDIQGWKPGSKLIKGKSVLDAFHQKKANTDNQLWVLQPQQWQFAPKITGFSPFYNENNPGASTLGVSGTGFYPGTTLALVLTSLVDPPTQGPPILAVTDFAGNFVMAATLLDPGWGYPGLSTEGEFSIAVFDNKAGILEGPSIASATAQWNGIGIAGFSNG